MYRSTGGNHARVDLIEVSTLVGLKTGDFIIGGHPSKILKVKWSNHEKMCSDN